MATYGTYRPASGQTLGREVAELAGRQHGVVALRQLQEAGYLASAVRKRVVGGSLHRLHRGVYAVGHSLVSLRGRWMAAVLACGPGALLSHRDCGMLRDLRATNRALTDVTVPVRNGRTRLGIDVHSGATLTAADIDEVDGIPCTGAARTLLDLAEILNPQALENAVHQAEIRRVFDLRAVQELLDRSPGRRGVTALRAVIAEGDFRGPGSRSEMEDEFARFCKRHGFPRPENNGSVDTPAGLREVDFLWRERRVVVETDSRRWHDNRWSMESDREKDLLLDAGDWDCVRTTWRQITRDDPLLVGALQRRLGGPEPGR